jgi:hypothetical protein
MATESPRPLLHPLTKSGLTNVKPGRWTSILSPAELENVAVTENADPGRRGRISSVPSPWARMQLFRDALVGESHPFRDEAVDDILDCLELVLFEPHLAGVELKPTSISLSTVLDEASAAREHGVMRFAEALKGLAPVVDHAAGAAGGEHRLNTLVLVRNGDRRDAPTLFATSPFTLFFTPATRGSLLPGYFQRPTAERPAGRPLRVRPPALARYVETHLLGALTDAPSAKAPELQALKRILELQVAEAREAWRGRPGTSRAAGDEPLALERSPIEPTGDIALHRVTEIPTDSALALVSPRPTAHRRRPLVLTNEASAAQRMYFPWLARPEGLVVDPARHEQGVLPGTSWKYEWIFPETQFLADRLIVLDHPLDAKHVRFAKGDPADTARDAARVLLPLKSLFFDYFSPAEAAELLELKVVSRQGAALKVRATLTVPTKGGPVKVERTYANNHESNSQLHLWPGVDLGADWHDYYLFHYLAGDDPTGKFDLDIRGASGPASVRPLRRDENAVVYHADAAPERIHVRAKVQLFGESGVAEGVILPRLERAPTPNEPAWTVAIDFGTSNSVVAYHPDGGRPTAFTLEKAGRVPLTESGDEKGLVDFYLDSFFFPAALDGRPFGTVIYRSNQPLSADDRQIPALAANIPFRGTIGGGGGASNTLLGDLKWGGAGEDTSRLTTLFLHQILQLVYAEARARGVRTDDMEVRWSFPIAFSKGRQQATIGQWEELLTEFRDRRVPRARVPDAMGAPSLHHLDESTAALYYFETDEIARGAFNQNTSAVKLTADVGGGTSDVSAYAFGEIWFRNSFLLGGRDLIGEGGGIYPRIAALLGGTDGTRESVRRMLAGYPSDHARFSFLVRQPWFEQQQAGLVHEGWFRGVQASLLYFFGTVLFNIGLRLRRVMDDERAKAMGVEPPDMLFFGGNGSTYLNWLTNFRPWNRAGLREEFQRALQTLFEAGYGKPLADTLVIHTSSRPKQEVALGLLARTDLNRDSRDAQGRPKRPSPSDPPVGEDVRVRAPDGPRDVPATHQLRGQDARDLGALLYLKPYQEREIARFNTAFVACLTQLGDDVDPSWGTVGRTVERLCRERLNDRFYDGRTKTYLAEQLKADGDIMLSLFNAEAMVTLREIETVLL